jgi:cell division protein FtsW
MAAVPSDLEPLALPAAGPLFDANVLFYAGTLMALGVAMVYSASVELSGPAFDLRQVWASPLRQGVFAVVGFLVMLMTAHCDYRLLAWAHAGAGWRAGTLYVLAAVLLMLVFVPGVGRESLGARRALELPGTGVSFQPSEFAKVVLVIWLAALLTRPRPEYADEGDAQERAVLTPTGWRRARSRRPASASWGNLHSFSTGFLPVLLSGGALIGLTAIEDFGTAALMGAVLLIMLLVAGARWSHLALCAVVAALAGVVLIWSKPYRWQRIQTWLTEAPNPEREGYQINQALLAIGSGGWFGCGLGAGVQKYGYLPQASNDFILAVICEELGVVGGLFVALVFLLLLWRGWNLARQARDDFGRLLALGLTMTICLQAAMNIGVVTNSIPTKGISLPFVSAGGSGVVFLGLAAGLLAAIGRCDYADPRPRSAA